MVPKRRPLWRWRHWHDSGQRLAAAGAHLCRWRWLLRQEAGGGAPAGVGLACQQQEAEGSGEPQGGLALVGVHGWDVGGVHKRLET